MYILVTDVGILSDDIVGNIDKITENSVKIPQKHPKTPQNTPKNPQNTPKRVKMCYIKVPPPPPQFITGAGTFICTLFLVLPIKCCPPSPPPLIPRLLDPPKTAYTTRPINLILIPPPSPPQKHPKNPQKQALYAYITLWDNGKWGFRGYTQKR